MHTYETEAFSLHLQAAIGRIQFPFWAQWNLCFLTPQFGTGNF